ncbi:hypothetical protein ABZP36_030526 [Zizania latifolia]
MKRPTCRGSSMAIQLEASDQQEDMRYMERQDLVDAAVEDTFLGGAAAAATATDLGGSAFFADEHVSSGLAWYGAEGW